MAIDIMEGAVTDKKINQKVNEIEMNQKDTQREE